MVTHLPSSPLSSLPFWYSDFTSLLTSNYATSSKIAESFSWFSLSSCSLCVSNSVTRFLNSVFSLIVSESASFKLATYYWFASSVALLSFSSFFSNYFRLVIYLKLSPFPLSLVPFFFRYSYFELLFSKYSAELNNPQSSRLIPEVSSSCFLNPRGVELSVFR